MRRGSGRGASLAARPPLPPPVPSAREDCKRGLPRLHANGAGEGRGALLLRARRSVLTRAWIPWDLTRDRLLPHPQVWPVVGSGARVVYSTCPTGFAHVAISGPQPGGGGSPSSPGPGSFLSTLVMGKVIASEWGTCIASWGEPHIVGRTPRLDKGDFHGHFTKRPPTEMTWAMFVPTYSSAQPMPKTPGGNCLRLSGDKRRCL